MEKEFYVIIPQETYGKEKRSFLASFMEAIFPQDTVAKIQTRNRQFMKLKKKLDDRVNTVRAGLESCNLRVTELGTKDLIELFYESYNPQTARNQKVENEEDLALEGGNSWATNSTDTVQVPVE